ncbi:MAG: NADH:ubiquinone reductase (Na(+)-transporting) subunit C [Rhizobiaceae bacterium]|nr:NADH:ubiquinone reductase (Na(+)-transporting) subunit C [Rhizobiaceae bacterium]
MADLNPLSWWRRFLALPNDSSVKTFLVAFMVASVSAVAVAVTAVSLRPLQDANVAREREQRMAEMLASVPGLADIIGDVDADALETRIVDLDSGGFAEDIDPATFDIAAASADPERSTTLDPADDVAGIGRRPDMMPAYLVRSDDKLLLAILPGYAAGYQSTIRAYVALEGDLNTIAAVSIYEQGETPGLGTRITDPAWQAQWAGKRVADDTGEIKLQVVRGGSGSEFEVDAITGATRSSMGVSNLVRFWLGDLGFGPFLARLRDGKV